MRLTDRTVKQLPAPQRGNKVTFDDVVKGLGCRVTAAGQRAFVLNYRRKADGRQRQITIGSFPDWGTHAAREEAKRLKRKVDGGGDPVGDIQSSRAAATVAELCARYEREVLPRNRPSTQSGYRDRSRLTFCRRLGG